MHDSPLTLAGQPLATASHALILLHGRGSSAVDILALARYLPVADYALLAPQATGHSWYPQSFLAPPAHNEPYLTAALAAVGRAVALAASHGIDPARTYLLGFSQGACLTLEYAARHATRYGGVAAFTGGLIGDQVYPERYAGDFGGTPCLLASADPDPHVPAARVRASAALITTLGAAVTEQITPGMGHTVTQPQLSLASELIFKPVPSH
ncbi:phospholipase [Hymenobacter sp. UV11]|uniref:alpha/beta hydrolase n=1 Tax=Hymenobacter sp. UV11 TaxID=1849735 RepID=UPI0010614902|nr:phospholipase [Hymenobacter sp. UV11]TDN36772.1 phospholipase [Hymenobacter sp. UV11]TFZ63695.1 phospholipase [Hymenobacter sp. UV11]